MFDIIAPEKIKMFKDCYVSWLPQLGRVRTGETLLLLSADGNEYPISAFTDVHIQKFFVNVGDHVSYNQPLCTVTCQDMRPSEDYIDKKIDEKIWNLAIAVNACFKGLLGSRGQSGQIAAKTVPIKTELPVKEGIDVLINTIVERTVQENLEQGDVIVIAEKPFPIVQGRLVPFSYIYDTDPKKLSREERQKLLDKLNAIVKTPVDMADLILADTYTEDPELGEMATVGGYNHNQLAYQIAQGIFQQSNVKVDVIISDTDTGIDIRDTIINCITIGATPVGATKGLSIYECMRAACAAEFSRGSKERIPIVICKPAYRCRKRPEIGEFRGYSGKLDVTREGGKIAFA